MIYPILKMGDLRLLRVAEPVKAFDTPELHQLIQDMFETMEANNGLGLAAPQIGVNLQLVIFGFEESERYPDAPSVPTTILINPVIAPITQDMEEGYEACLSIPGMKGMVNRFTQIRYEGFDQFGKPIDRTVEGMHARVVQHECDHVWGKLYPMRMNDLSTFGFVDD